jgi:Ca-activated chloride channel homolog
MSGKCRVQSAECRVRKCGTTRFALLALLLLSPVAWAEERPMELVRRGNEEYAAGKFDEALEAYRKAGELDPRLATPELRHNEAAALYKLGKMDDARDLWTSVKEAGTPAFEARTRYNLANCDYAEALAALEKQEGQKALQSLEKAAAGYQNALRLDPQFANARANLELASRLHREIEQAKSEQQKQDGEKGDQKRDPNSPQTQPQQKQPQSRPADKDQKKDQQDQQSDQQQDQSDQQKNPQQEDDPNQQRSKPENAQDPNQSQGNEPNQAPEPNQPKPGEDPNAAGQSNAQSQPADQEAADADPNRPPVEMTRAQAERLLQKVRDAEKKRRDLLMQQRRAQQKPVERDW